MKKVREIRFLMDIPGFDKDQIVKIDPGQTTLCNGMWSIDALLEKGGAEEVKEDGSDSFDLLKYNLSAIFIKNSKYKEVGFFKEILKEVEDYHRKQSKPGTQG